MGPSLGRIPAALKLQPGLLEARINVAGVLLQKGLNDESIEQSLKVLEFRPDMIEGCINIGIAFMHKGILDQAIESFKKALAIDPNSLVAH